MTGKLGLAAIVCFAALAAGECLAQEGLSPWGATPGYYPGQANGIRASQRAEWLAWMRAHGDDIDAIGAKINAIKAGAPAPGCFGRALFDCVASLAQTLVITDWYQTSQTFYRPATDVNGKPIGLKRIDFTAYAPGVKTASEELDKHNLRLDFSDRSLVNQLAFEVDFSGRTQEEYDRTGVYELFSAVAKDHCPALTRNELARFIENKLKPAMRFVKEPHAAGISNSKRFDSPFTPFCGRELLLSANLAHSTKYKSQGNATGQFGGTVLVIR